MPPMKNSIQYFLENGIPELEKIRISFMKEPGRFDEYMDKIGKMFLKATCHFTLELIRQLLGSAEHVAVSNEGVCPLESPDKVTLSYSKRGLTNPPNMVI